MVVFDGEKRLVEPTVEIYFQFVLVYEALYETTKRISEEESKLCNVVNLSEVDSGKITTSIWIFIWITYNINVQHPVFLRELKNN